MTYQVNEQVTARLSGVFKDDEGSLLPASAFNSLTATLYVKPSGAIVNNCNQRNILNANGGSVDESGNFALQLAPADNSVVEQATVGAEHHVLLLEWVYETTKKGKQEIDIAVKNLAKVS